MAVKLFIGSLAYSTTSERLRETFARFGSVESASVVTDRDTGRSRGFGFVEMTTAEEAKNAVAGLNGTELDGRRINVENAKPAGSSAGGGQHRAAGWSGSRR
jgi:RNA recognition motif-containing protein